MNNNGFQQKNTDTVNKLHAQLLARRENLGEDFFILSQDERKKMRENITAFIAEHPLATKRGTGASFFAYAFFSIQKISNNFFVGFSGTRMIFSYRSYVLAFFVGFFILLGGGVSYVAEGALPGGILYPIKVSVNEEVRGMLVYSAEAKAEWDAFRAERRLEEVSSLLAKEQKAITPETAHIITERFTQHVEAFSTHLTRMETENPEKADSLRARFFASLSAHERVLRSLAFIENSDVVISGTRSFDGLALKEDGVEVIRREEIEIFSASATNTQAESAVSRESTTFSFIAQKASESGLASQYGMLEPLFASLRVYTSSDVKRGVAHGEGELKGDIGALSGAGISKDKSMTLTQNIDTTITVGEISTTSEDMYVFEAHTISESAVRDLRASVYVEIERVRSAFTSAKLNDSQKKELSLRIERIEQLVRETDRLLEIKKYDEAFAFYRDSFSYLVELSAWFRLSKTSSTVRLPALSQEIGEVVEGSIPVSPEEDGIISGEGASVGGNEEEYEESSGFSADIPSETNPLPQNIEVTLTHRFENDTHIFSGKFWGSSCDEVSTKTGVGRDDNIAIAISVSSIAEICIMLAQEHIFTVEVKAPENAKLSSVTLNGREVMFRFER